MRHTRMGRFFGSITGTGIGGMATNCLIRLPGYGGIVVAQEASVILKNNKLFRIVRHPYSKQQIQITKCQLLSYGVK
jgi:hypothetical protein